MCVSGDATTKEVARHKFMKKGRITKSYIKIAYISVFSHAKHIYAILISIIISSLRACPLEWRNMCTNRVIKFDLELKINFSLYRFCHVFDMSKLSAFT